MIHINNSWRCDDLYYYKILFCQVTVQMYRVELESHFYTKTNWIMYVSRVMYIITLLRDRGLYVICIMARSMLPGTAQSYTAPVSNYGISCVTRQSWDVCYLFIIWWEILAVFQSCCLIWSKMHLSIREFTPWIKGQLQKSKAVTKSCLETGGDLLYMDLHCQLPLKIGVVPFLVTRR